MIELHGVDDDRMTVDYGCPTYIVRDPFSPDYGYPVRETNGQCFEQMPIDVQACYERRERMRGMPGTATFVRVRKPPFRWVKQDNGRWISKIT